MQRSNQQPPSRGQRKALALWSLAFGCVVFLLLLGGCSSAHYRRSADTQVYGIISEYEEQIFGQTNHFTINTPYSERIPAEITPEELVQQRLEGGELRLTLADALGLSITNSRTYQSEKERLYLTALSLTGARHEFAPGMFAILGGSVNRTTSGTTAGAGNSQIGLSQLFKSGGKLSVTLANDLLRYYTGNPSVNPVSTFSVNIAQPLLRGFGKNDPSVENLTQAERNVIYAVRNYSFFQNEFALGIVTDYLDLVAQKDDIRNRYTNYLSRVQSTQRLEARAKDRESLNSVDQARQAELTAKNNYVNALATFLNTLDQFKIRLGLPLGVKLHLNDGDLEDLQNKGLIPVSLDREKAYEIAVKHQMQILNAIDQFEDSQRKVRLAIDRLRPGLDLVGSAAINSDPPSSYTEYDLDKWRGSVGVELDLPLDRLSERNSYRSSLVSFESQLRSLTLTLDNLRDSIARGMRTLEQRRQNYEIQQNAMELADRRVTSTTLLLQAGRAEVRDLVDAQDAQISAQNSVTAALVAYQEARLRLMLDIGVLETHSEQFWLQDQLVGVFADLEVAGPKVELPRDRLIPPDEFFNN